MVRKKTAKAKSRWQPLQDGSRIMQEIFIPEVDEHGLRPETFSKEELLNCCKYIDQSNKTVEVENSVLERYLNRMDPNALMKMTQILDAATTVLQKTAHLGPTQSSMSVMRDPMGNRKTDESVTTFLRVGDPVGSTTTTRMAFFNLADKAGPKVQIAQKIEIVTREIEEIKNTLENFRKTARDLIYILKCRKEEMSERLREVSDAQTHFEQKLLVEGVDPITGKLPGEKFIRYLEIRLKTEEMEIARMRMKTGSLKTHLKRVQQHLAQKEELGEILHAVDFEQLQIENRECQDRLDEKVAHLIDTKKINGKYGTTLNVNKKKLEEQTNRLAELHQKVISKEKMINLMVEDEVKVTAEVQSVSKALGKILLLMKSYTVPELIEYIRKKAELYDLKKEIKVCERKMKLKDLALASQVHRIKSINEEYSKSQSFVPSTSRSRTLF